MAVVCGAVAEWLRSGLQNRLHQFNSGRGLHFPASSLTVLPGTFRPLQPPDALLYAPIAEAASRRSPVAQW